MIFFSVTSPTPIFGDFFRTHSLDRGCTAQFRYFLSVSVETEANQKVVDREGRLKSM